MLKRLLMIICGLLLCVSSSDAARRALLVGVANYQAENCGFINRKEQSCDLDGPVNDVWLMQDGLRSVYGFQDAEIQVLLNEQASKAGIERVFQEWLLNGSSAGDLAVFYFSGHGTQVPDANGDEDDGKDEALLPYDMTPDAGHNILLDDELGGWLGKLAEQNVNVVVILDSCFSGGATRSRTGETLSSLEATPGWRSRYLPLANYQPTAAAKALPSGPDAPPSIIFMGASQEHEDALELQFPDSVYSGFSFALCDSMTRLTQSTYGQLFEHARDVVIDRLKLPQTPYIEASVAQLMTLAFAAGKTTESQPAAPAESSSNKVVVALEPCQSCSAADIQQLTAQLAKLPMVQLAVPDAFFDRLLRIEKQSGHYQARLLNRIGDVWKLAPVAALSDIAEQARPGLEYAYMVKQLARLTPEKQAFRVDVDLALKEAQRRDFKVGEQVVFTVKAERDCYILLVNLDSQGNVHVIFPNQLHQDNFLRAETLMEIPDEQMRAEQFIFEFGLPVGEETVKAIATTRPLNLQEIGLSDFKELFQTIPETTRTIFVRDVREQLESTGLEWSEDTVTIRS